MNSRNWVSPFVGLALAACAVSAHAGTVLDWTSALSISAESAGSSDMTSFGKGTDLFSQNYNFKSGSSDIEFTLTGAGVAAGPGTIDRYGMRARTLAGWVSNQFSTTFDFNVLKNDVVLQYAEGGYDGPKTFSPPTMTIYSGGTELTTLTSLGDTWDLSSGMEYSVKIAWESSPLAAKGDFAFAAFTMSPTAVPGAGAFALLGFGATASRRRRNG